MPLQRPTFDTINAKLRAVFKTQLPEADTTTPASLLGVLITSIAQACHALYGYISSYASIPFIHLATENAQLDLFGMEYGVARTPATYATGSVSFTGNAGSLIGVGALLQRADGKRYQTTLGGSFSGTTLTLPLEAIDAGVGANATAGTTLTLVNPIAGVNNSATTSAGITGGSDEEDFTTYQNRLLQYRRNRPRGGSVADYELWTLEVPNITRVFVLPQGMGANSVVVLLMMDDTYTNGLPLSGDIATVTAHLTTLLPVGAELFVNAPTAVPLNLTINLSPNTPDVQAAVTQAIANLIRAEARPAGTLLRSHITEAISGAIGEGDHELVAPSANVVTIGQELTTLGTITFGALS
jgi:uncharacterized phage protein gp47/JayE